MPKFMLSIDGLELINVAQVTWFEVHASLLTWHITAHLSGRLVTVFEFDTEAEARLQAQRLAE